MPDGHNHITLITYDGQPQLTPSDELVARELTELVYRCKWLVGVTFPDWSRTGLAVLRSTWTHTLGR